MPKSGGHVINCDLPVYVDSYIGCGFHCSYCSQEIKGRNAGSIRRGEGVLALRAFINGKRTVTVNWCDWPIPVHLGVLSDPFQPCEEKEEYSYTLLREFATSGHPVVISTKGVGLLSTRKYISLLHHCNAVLQVSMTSPRYDGDEMCPSYKDRFLLLDKLSRASKRLIVRIQPYQPEDKPYILKMLNAYAWAGVHGITIEGMKWNQGTTEFTEWFGGSMVYPVSVLLPDYLEIKQACHDVGLRFYCAENRLRYISDSPTCCGTDGVPGFRENRANINHLPIEFTDRMAEPGTGQVFRSREWSTGHSRAIRETSYREAMIATLRNEEDRPPNFERGDTLKSSLCTCISDQPDREIF